MGTSMWRAAAAGTTVVLAAGIGVVTNVITDRWSVSLFALLIALVVIGVALQVAVTLLEGDGAGTVMRARATDDAQIVQAGRDINVAGRDVNPSGQPGDGPRP